MLEWLMFHRIVKKGREVRGGLLRTLVEQLVANVDPPGVFVASIRLPQHAATMSLVSRRWHTCAVARHTWNDDEHPEIVAALAPPTLTRSVLLNPSAS